MTRTFEYTNSMGIPKKLVVHDPNEAGKYPVTLWEMLHGEFCGNGEMTRDELNDYLKHYGVTDQI